MEKSKEISEELIHQMIANLVGYSESHGDLLTKYHEQFYLSYFDRVKIDQASKEFPSHKEIEVEEFVRIFLNLITHQSD